MPADTSPSQSWTERFMESFCQRLPNCTKAMALVETGCERELSPRERLALKYHGRLCPFCGCAAGKFDSALARLRACEATRRS